MALDEAEWLLLKSMVETRMGRGQSESAACEAVYRRMMLGEGEYLDVAEEIYVAIQTVGMKQLLAG